MVLLMRVFLASASIVGGIVALVSGDGGIVGMAIAIALLGMLAVSLILMPGMWLQGVIGSAVGEKWTDAESGPFLWAAATLGGVHITIVQVAWLLVCSFLLGVSTNGNTAPWALGLLLVGASFWSWAQLASQDAQAGLLTATVQLSFYGMGLISFWLTLLFAPGAVILAFALLVSCQLTAIPIQLAWARFETHVQDGGN